MDGRVMPPRKYSQVERQNLDSTSSPQEILCDPTQGEQIDIEQLLSLPTMHKLDRTQAHKTHAVGCEYGPGDYKVIAFDGSSYTSECKTCGLRVKSMLSECQVSK